MDASIPNEGLGPAEPRAERWEDANMFKDGFVSDDPKDCSNGEFLALVEEKCADANMFKDGLDSEDPKAD